MRTDRHVYRLLEDEDRPDEECPDEDRDELAPDDREGDEALGALCDDDDREGELTLGARLDEPDDLDAVGLLRLTLDLDGDEARGDGALRLPLEVRGMTTDRLDLEPLVVLVRGMTTGVRVEGAVRLGAAVDRPVVPELRDPTLGADRLTGARVDGVTGVRLVPPERDRPDRDDGALPEERTGVRLVLGARERPDEDEGARVDGEDLVPEGDAALPLAEPWFGPTPVRVPTGLRDERKRFPPPERPPPH